MPDWAKLAFTSQAPIDKILDTVSGSFTAIGTSDFGSYGTRHNISHGLSDVPFVEGVFRIDSGVWRPLPSTSQEEQADFVDNVVSVGLQVKASDIQLVVANRDDNNVSIEYRLVLFSRE